MNLIFQSKLLQFAVSLFEKDEDEQVELEFVSNVDGDFEPADGLTEPDTDAQLDGFGFQVRRG